MEAVGGKLGAGISLISVSFEKAGNIGGEVEGGDVDLGGPVAGLAEDPGAFGATADFLNGPTGQGRVLGRPAEGHEATHVGRNGGNIGRRVREVACPSPTRLLQFIGLHEWDAALVHDDAATGEYARGIGVEFIGEQNFTDADGVSGVNDDDIERVVGRLFDVFDPIADDDRGAWIGPGVTGDTW